MSQLFGRRTIQAVSQISPVGFEPNNLLVRGQVLIQFSFSDVSSVFPSTATQWETLPAADAANLTVSAIAGVPASNLYGRLFGRNERRWTSFIISPPPRNGGMDSSNAAFPYNAPIPVGPHILCAEKARKSASRA